MLAVSHWTHRVVRAAAVQAKRRFRAALRDPEAAQRARLHVLLLAAERSTFGQRHGLTSAWRWEDLAMRLPVADYAANEPWIGRQRRGEPALTAAPCNRFQPTSGSTSARKWIPYGPAFLAELDEAASVWMSDLYAAYPRIARGRHYWSMSWMPDELRRERDAGTADVELFPPWKRALLARSQVSLAAVERAASSEAAQIEAAHALAAAADLSLISVWSPTFLIELLRVLAAHRHEIAARLGGERGARLAAWGGVASADFFAAFWPRLALVSAWDSASSRAWSRDLAALFPQAAFQGKGLWATEGVVTLPWTDGGRAEGEDPVLAVTSHVLEFRDLRTEAIVAPWGLREGQEVQPILSTGSGLWRYPLPDRLRVTGFAAKTPRLAFLGRLAGTDLVGEKLDPAFVAEAFSQVEAKLGTRSVALFAVRGARTRYEALVVGGRASEALVAKSLEEELEKAFHYRVARELGQLGPVAVVARPDAGAVYGEYCRRRGILGGEAKVETLSEWRLPGTSLAELCAP